MVQQGRLGRCRSCGCGPAVCAEFEMDGMDVVERSPSVVV